MNFICPGCKIPIDDSIFLENAEPDDFDYRYVTHCGKVEYQATEYWEGKLYADCPHCSSGLIAETEGYCDGQYGNDGNFEALQNEVWTKFDISVSLEVDWNNIWFAPDTFLW